MRVTKRSEDRRRQIRTSGSEGGAPQSKATSLPLSSCGAPGERFSPPHARSYLSMPCHSGTAGALARGGGRRLIRHMENSLMTLITLPAWGVPPLDCENPTLSFYAGSFYLPARTVSVETALLHRLIHEARAAALRAYAPFSGFRVGAAVLMADDPARRVITGANVENSSYSLTQCAERTALQTAAAAGHRRLRYLAVSCAATTPGTPLRQRSMCGSCRQVLREFADDETLVLLDRGTVEPSADVFDVERLLPHGFRFER